MRHSATALALAVVLISGCAGADVMLVDPSQKYEPTENVQFLLEEPSRPYEMIAVIEAKGSQYNNQSQVVRAARREAEKIGAHAIMPVSTEGRNVAPQMLPNPVAGGPPIYMAGGTQMTMKFTAIRFTDGE